ncbi:hypothetical protein B0H14DRAFT_3032763 [Mycena olivaceomarginata]|nr:hypothetical protein B0H14DRAFT_3032763 [Mycena olivaceomarginata]
MRPTAPFRLSLLLTSLGTRPPPILPFHARQTLFSSFSTRPSHAQHQQSTKSQQSYFCRLDNSIAENAIETWFYCFWAWQWWKRRAGQESEDAVES